MTIEQLQRRVENVLQSTIQRIFFDYLSYTIDQVSLFRRSLPSQNFDLFCLK